MNYLLIGFQDPATPIMEAIVDVHNYVMFYLLLIIFFVVTIMVNIYYDFSYVQHSTDQRSIEQRKSVFAINKITHSTTLEIVWTLLPVAVLVAISIPSFGLLYAMDEACSPRLIIKVIGNQWYWSYEYSNSQNAFLRNVKPENWIKFDAYMVPETELAGGTPRILTTDNILVVPTHTHIQFLITANDVLHSWAVPSLGIKVDAVPGRMNQVFAYIKREGVFFGQCSEICGVQHGFMPIVVKSMEPVNFIRHYAQVASLIDAQYASSLIPSTTPSKS